MNSNRWNSALTSVVLSILLLSVCSAQAAGENISQRWGRYYTDTSNWGDDVPSALQVGSDGSVYVTGIINNFSTLTMSYKTIKYGPDGVQAAGGWPAVNFNIRYADVWRYRPVSILDETQRALYIAGACIGDGDGDAIISLLRYNIDTGNLVWARSYDLSVQHNINWSYATAIAMDHAGYIWLTGEGLTDSRSGYLTLKCAPSGDMILNRFQVSPLDLTSAKPSALVVDSQNNVYVSGYIEEYYSENATQDYYTLKYSSVGNLLWEQRYNRRVPDPWDSATLIDLDDWPAAMALNSQGGVVITGASGLYNHTKYDFLTVAYAADGSLIWQHTEEGVYWLDLMWEHPAACAVAVNASGDVFVAGTTVQAGTDDYLVVKYHGATGATMWTCRRQDGAFLSEDFLRDLALDSAGNAYVTGRLGTQDNRADFGTVKVNGITGQIAWERRFNGYTPSAPQMAFDEGMLIAIDASNNVIVAGAAEYEFTDYPLFEAAFGTVKYGPAQVQSIPANPAPATSTIRAEARASIEVPAVNDTAEKDGASEDF